MAELQKMFSLQSIHPLILNSKLILKILMTTDKVKKNDAVYYHSKLHDEVHETRSWALSQRIVGWAALYITFLKCMTRFMRLEVERWAWEELARLPCIPYIRKFSLREILAKMTLGRCVEFLLGRCVEFSLSPIFAISKTLNEDVNYGLFFTASIFGDFREVTNSVKIKPTRKFPIYGITFLNCMTRFMRLEVELWAWEELAELPWRRSSMEILFLMPWYSIFCLVVSGQYTRISIYSLHAYLYGLQINKKQT